MVMRGRGLCTGSSGITGDSSVPGGGISCALLYGLISVTGLKAGGMGEDSFSVGIDAIWLFLSEVSSVQDFPEKP
jgi:hypothetical protein